MNSLVVSRWIVAGVCTSLAACASDVVEGVAEVSEEAVSALTEDDEQKPPCMKRPDQVVLIGDSYIEWVSHTFPEDLAREAGVTYRNYAVGGYSMASGGIGSIPSEFDDAVKDDPDIIAAVVDGGGNDVLVPDVAQFPDSWECKNNAAAPEIPDCQKIVALAVDTAKQVMLEMADAGVRDVVYFFYPRVPEGTLIGGWHPNEILEYSLPLAREACETASKEAEGRLTCHFVDLVPVFEGHPEYFAFTDIHPNPRGSAAMAKAIWETMQTACIAQPESSGCCAP